MIDLTHQDERLFECRDGVLVRREGVAHRGEDYDENGFGVLADMQSRHFWYRGRHRFLREALREALKRAATDPASARAVDLGGGCGGWCEYLGKSLSFGELALADSSALALRLASSFVGPEVKRFQVDLLDLGWRDRWDFVFLLDVLEHIPDDAAVMQQVRQCLCPGGSALVTMPALPFFWSYNDEFALHKRRYTKRDMRRLADEAGLELVTVRYFMFLLSPLMLLRKLGPSEVRKMPLEERTTLMRKTHRVPWAPLNALLSWVFAAETPLGMKVSFPWGTSILGVFRKQA